MGEVSAGERRAAAKIDGQFSPGLDKIVRGCVFGATARAIWDFPDAVIAQIANCNPRTARRYLSGEQDPPPIVITAMLVAITTNDAQGAARLRAPRS